MPSFREQATVVAIGGVFALGLAVSLSWRPAPGGAALPTAQVAPAAPTVTPVAPAAVQEAPTPAPLPTGYIEPIEAAPAEPAYAPVQAAPVAPVEAPVEAPIVITDLVPIPTEPAGWHPPFASGYSPSDNYVTNPEATP